MIKEDQISVLKSPLEAKLIGLVEPVLASLTYGLWDLEVVGGASAIVRITLENIRSEADAIGIDDCAKVHRELNPLFDVWDPLATAYTLEVSSPGERASLRTLRQFKMAIGDKVRFQTDEALPMPPPAKARRNWEGVLKEIKEAEVSASEKGPSLEIEDSLGVHKIPLDKIRSAQWVRDWTLRNEEKA